MKLDLVINYPVLAKGGINEIAVVAGVLIMPVLDNTPIQQGQTSTATAKYRCPGTKNNAEPLTWHLPSRRPISYLVAAIHLHLNQHMLHIGGFSTLSGLSQLHPPRVYRLLHQHITLLNVVLDQGMHFIAYTLYYDCECMTTWSLVLSYTILLGTTLPGSETITAPG